MMLKENIQNTNLCDFLSKCLFDIEKRYSNYSSRQVAKLINLSNSTYGRIKNKEIQKPTFKVALEIIKSYSNGGNLKEFIGKFYPELLFEFTNTYNGNEEAIFIANETEKYFEDPRTYKLMVVATTNNGLSINFVKEQYGLDGLNVLNNLIDKKILTQKENGKIFLTEKTINASQGTVKKLMQNLLNNNYDENLIGQEKNWLSLQYQSVNRDYVYPKLKNIIKNATQEIREIFNDEDAQGTDIMWAGLALDDINTMRNETINKGDIIQ